MFGLGFWEIAMIMGVALLILGPTKLPELARSLGKTLREFRKATEDFKSTIDEELHKPEGPSKQLPSAREPEPVSAEESEARREASSGKGSPDPEHPIRDVEASEPADAEADEASSPRSGATASPGPSLDVRPPEEPSVARTPPSRGSEPR